MILSMRREYNGNCRAVLDHYKAVFNDAVVNFNTFAEMPGVESFGITGEGLSLIWKSTIAVKFGEFNLCFEMSDSILYAMQQSSFMDSVQIDGFTFLTSSYPQICVSFEDEQKEANFRQKAKLNSNNIDANNIQWLIEKNKQPSASLYFEFDGFCQDVIKYYETAFDTKAVNVIRYDESPDAGSVTGLGSNKVYSAHIFFDDGANKYAIKLCDTLNSAQKNLNTYNPKDLLFYKSYNPILCLSNCEHDSLLKSFESLSIGAKLNKKPELNEEGAYHASLIDRYGICWEIYSVIPSCNQNYR